MRRDKPIVLVLCGGRSLRLWPLSRYHSKNFFYVFGFSPLELTLKRFKKITPLENIFFVANQNEKAELYKAKYAKRRNIFFEPLSKNTASAVLLSLLYLRRYSQQSIIITPVDSLIGNESVFFKAIVKALKAASKGQICTLGIVPKELTIHFGYIEAGREDAKRIFSVKRFIEKPSAVCARRLIKKGNCFYNSGIFVSSVSTLINEYQKYYPRYEDFVRNFGNNKNKITLLYRKIEDIPFDKAIMEKSKCIKMIKANFSWKDFGTWSAIYEVLPKDERGNVMKGSPFIYNGKNNFIYLDNRKKKVLLLGLRDVFFIDTKDYSLLAHRNYLDNLKAALKRLERGK